MRASDRNRSVETPVHMLVDDNGRAGPPWVQNIKLRPRRLSCSRPVRKLSITVPGAITLRSRLPWKNATVHGDQLQGVTSAVAVARLAQCWLAPRVATDGYIAMRFSIRCEFISKEAILGNLQEVKFQSRW